jgi:hypothetical protein
MSKKALKLAGRHPMLLALIMATLALGLLFSGWLTPLPTRAQAGGGNSSSGNENTNCDNPTTSLWCAGDAQLVLKNVTISPAAPTNAPYDCIVCVCDTVSANLSWFTVPSTNATQTCHTCDGSTPTNYCDPIVYTAGASPYNITNEWWNSWWWDWTNGVGDSVSFSFTNATTGEVWFDNISAMMTTNAPGCNVSIDWATNAVSCRSYAFVAVDSISPDWSTGSPVTNDPCPTYLVQFCPSNYVTVTASPDPGMDDQFLPAGWNMSGGIATTNADGSPSRTKRLVDTGTVGSVTVTATSGCSSKSVKIIVYQAKVELDADRGTHGILNGLFDVGHSWWNLTIQPADVYPFLQGYDPDTGDSINLSGWEGPQGMGGFYDHGHMNGPGVVQFKNPQPDGTNGAVHTATGTYWWCVNIGCYIGALQYVFDLNEECQDGVKTYHVFSDNCSTEAEAVGNNGCVSSINTILPFRLSKWLNKQLPQPPVCSCSN